MELIIFLDLTFLLIIAFSISKKHLYSLENIFMLIMIEFMFTCYIGIVFVNMEVWELSTNKNQQLIIFYIHELITIPVMIVWFHNIWAVMKTTLSRIIFSISFVPLLYSPEFLLVHWQVIIYRKWSSWQALLALAILLLVTNRLQLVFRRILRKDGIKC